MPEDKRSPVNIDIGVKAALEARVSTEIPKEASGRFIDAITDVFRPVSEYLGLKGDKIRLERAKVAIEIAELAQSRIQTEGKAIGSPPNKFLLPFFEKASLENADQAELMERWADLLATATESYSPGLIRFTNVLAEIGPKEINFLNILTRKYRGKMSLSHIEDTPSSLKQDWLEFEIESSIDLNSAPGIIIDNILHVVEYPGSMWITLNISVENKGYEIDNEFWSDDLYEVTSILESLGVIKEFSFTKQIGILYISGSGFSLTSFGLRFMMACDRILHDDLIKSRELIK